MAKTQPEVISILTLVKKIQVTMSPQSPKSVNNFHPTICPSVTHETEKHELKSLKKIFTPSIPHYCIMQQLTILKLCVM